MNIRHETKGIRKTEMRDFHTQGEEFFWVMADACPIWGIRVRFWVSFSPLLQ